MGLLGAFAGAHSSDISLGFDCGLECQLERDRGGGRGTTKRAVCQGGMILKSDFVLGREILLPETLPSRRDSGGLQVKPFPHCLCQVSSGVFILSSHSRLHKAKV